MNMIKLICTLWLIWAYIQINCSIIINRDRADSTPVSCNNTLPCIINCNADSSCRDTHILCPTNGIGDCTINVYGRYGAEGSILNASNITNVMINLYYGNSFENGIVNLQNINDLIINIIVVSGIRWPHDAFYNSQININSMSGNLIATTIGSHEEAMRESKITIIGGVNGNVHFIQNSTANRCYYQMIFIVDNIGGNLILEDSQGSVQSFEEMNLTVTGTIGGNAEFLAGSPIKSLYTFRYSTININNVNGITQFIANNIGTSNFNSAVVNIQNCPIIVMYSDGFDDFFDSNFVFGSNVDLINITIDWATRTALEGALFDAQYANELILNCIGDSPCDDVDIKCPEDNQNNMCRIYCSSDASCNNINLFTTNGYCIDATFYCLNSLDESDCNIGTSSRVYCIKGTNFAYGDEETHCYMEENGINYYCKNVDPAECSPDGELLCGQTLSPSSEPTTTPTIPTAIPTFPTRMPTYPSMEPTERPTPEPTASEICNSSTEYNLLFIIDESQSVGEENYKNSIDFIIELIKTDINKIANLSVLSYSLINDIVYTFDDIQNDDRSLIINALINEKDDYDEKNTQTLNALINGLEQFQNNPNINDLDNNLILLFTDGRPTIPVCDATNYNLLRDLREYNIRIIIIGITPLFIKSELSCIANNGDIFEINDFTSDQFQSIEHELRNILCPCSNYDDDVSSVVSVSSAVQPNNDKYQNFDFRGIPQNDYNYKLQKPKDNDDNHYKFWSNPNFMFINGLLFGFFITIISQIIIVCLKHDKPNGYMKPPFQDDDTE